MAQGGNVSDPLEIQFSCKTIFSSGLGGNWYTQTLPNANTKLSGQEIPTVNLSHTMFTANSCFLDPIFGSDPSPAGPGQPEPRPRSGRDLPGRDFPDLRFFEEVGNARGGAAEVGNLPQEGENRRFGERVGQIQAGQGFSRPPLILRGRANPCPA